MAKRVLVTSALPYANGPIHLGHMLEAVQTDVYVRARKLAGDDCIYMWADDTHGTPILLRAQQEGIQPEELIARAYEQHRADYTDFGIDFDIFYTTHSEEAKHHAYRIFERLRDRGYVVSRDVDQLYCPHDNMFLPDRYVRGTCPKCKAVDQYGDSCEVCGSTYSSQELLEPRCSICGTTPVMKASEHIFVQLHAHEAFLRAWHATGGVEGGPPLQSSVANYVRDWVEGGLRDWDISRDAPYFGFEIPDYPGKYFYVWFDAPIGYIAATQKYCDEQGLNFEDYWGGGSRDEIEIVHVIGKDIVYFHCLFWPVMLHAASYTTPAKIQTHGWLTVNGEKMSKSRGTFILARTYLDHLPADAMRYYFAAKLSGAQEDFDLALTDFVNRCDAELVHKTANLCSRCVKFVRSKLDGTIGDLPEDTASIVAKAQQRVSDARDAYLRFDSAKAVRLALEISDDFNLYVTEQAPWKLVKTEPERAREICSAGIYASQLIATIFKPIMPVWAEKLERFLRLPQPLGFQSVVAPLPCGHVIDDYETLFEKLDPKAIDAVIEASKETTGSANKAASATTAEQEVPLLANETTIDALDAVDLRVAKVIDCQAVEGAKKLLTLTLDLGPLGQRQVLSGIALSYDPKRLIGKHVAVFANLKPRKMKFGLSEGMVLAAGESDANVVVVELDPSSRPGDRIR